MSSIEMRGSENERYRYKVIVCWIYWSYACTLVELSFFFYHKFQVVEVNDVELNLNQTYYLGKKINCKHVIICI